MDQTTGGLAGLAGLAALALALSPAVAAAQWADDGGDHAGADWVVQDGAVLSGVHTNIGRLVVPDGVTVRVAPRQGEAGGLLEVHACELELAGVIDADGAGHPGAARAANQGGRQGAGPGGGCGGGPGSCVGQGATGGSYGGVGGTAETNNNWARGNECLQCDNPAEAHCYGAAGQAQGTPDGDDLAPGAGGGSGGNSCNCNGAGGLGGAGGGAVRLLINEEALIDGVITANGVTPAPDDSPCGYHPGGGGGAGGGILVQAEELSGGGSLSANGGGGGETDGCPASCGNWAWAGGGGGGGRIKTFSLNDTFDGALEVAGGEGGGAPGGNYAFAGLNGGVGSIHRGEELVEDLIPCEGPPRMRINHGLTFGEAQEFTLTLDARDPDGGAANYHWDLDDDGEFDDDAGEEIVHQLPDDGTYPIAVRGTDEEGDVAVYEFEVIIVNRPPVIRSDPPGEALEDDEYVYAIDAVDPAGAHDPLAVELIQSPVGMQVDGLLLTWTPTIFQALDGQFVVSIRVTDDDEGAVSQSWPLTVRWLDGDGDGMSDGWEREFGLDPDDPGDADDDPDGDGLSNLQEFRERRDPTRSGIPDVPTPLSPDDEAWVVTSTPDLVIANAFDPDNDVLTYSFQVAEDPEFRRVHFAEQAVVEGPEGRTSWRVRLPLREGLTYFWRARASDGPFHSEYSQPRSFTVNSFPEPPNLPELQAPRDGGPVATPTPELTVAAVHDPDGDPVAIHFELYADEAGLDLVQGVVTAQERGDAVVIGVPDPPLAEDTDYWWRAEAVDSAELSSGFTELWSFRVNSDNGAPPAPELLRPSDGAQIAGFTVLLAMRAGVDPDGDAVTHRVEVDRSPEFDSPLLEVFADLQPAMGDVVTVELNGRQDNVRYHWRARAEDGLDSSEWVSRRFVVNFGNEAPGPPTPLSPVSGERVSPLGLTLTLAPARDPDHDPLRYVFQVSASESFDDLAAESEPVAADDEDAEIAWQIEGLDEGSYFWRAHAVDPQRLRSAWSTAARFVVDPDVAAPVGDEGGDGDEGAGDDGQAGAGGAGGGDGGGGGIVAPEDVGGAGGGDDGLPAGGQDAGAFGGERSKAGGCNCRAAGAAGGPTAEGALLGLLLGVWALGRR